MALPGDITDRKYKSFIENEDDQGIDNRVNDVSLNNKLIGVGGVLNSVLYKSISVAYPNTTTEVYSFFEGGLAGTLNATITLVYTNSSKTNLSTVVKV